jgi:hypothetical protein
MPEQISIQEFRRRYPANCAAEELAPGEGWCTYEDADTRTSVLYKYGRTAELAFTHPPAMLGDGSTLREVSPPRSEDTPSPNSLGFFRAPPEVAAPDASSPVSRYLASGYATPQINLPSRGKSNTRPPAQKWFGR